MQRQISTPGIPRTPLRRLLPTWPLGQENLILVALVLLCVALVNNVGDYSLLALSLVLASLGTAILAWRSPSLPVSRSIVFAAILIFAAESVQFNLQNKLPLYLTLALYAASALCLILVNKPLWYQFSALLLFLLSLAPLLLTWTWGRVKIDVFTFLQGGSLSILHGQDPYTPLYSALLATPAGKGFYGPEHITYFPLILILDVPARLLGDVRLTSVLALLLTATITLLLARRAGLPRSTQRYLLLLLLVLPLTDFLIVNSWIDPVMIAAFVCWLILRDAHPRLAVIPLALAIGIKITILLFLLPFFLWLPKARREITGAALLAALSILPFALRAGFGRFFAAVATSQINAAPRPDSLNLGSFLISRGWPTLPGYCALIAIALAALIALRWQPRSYTDLLISSAVVGIICFLFSQGYLNYYYDSAACLIFAFAVGKLQPRPPLALPGPNLPPTKAFVHLWVRPPLVPPAHQPPPQPSPPRKSFTSPSG